MDMVEVNLGELAFTNIQIPFKTLDIANNGFKPIDIRVDSDFVLLEHGQRMVTFKCVKDEYETQIMCFDRLGRLIGSANLEHHVERDNVAQ